MPGPHGSGEAGPGAGGAAGVPGELSWKPMLTVLGAQFNHCRKLGNPRVYILLAYLPVDFTFDDDGVSMRVIGQVLYAAGDFDVLPCLRGVVEQLGARPRIPGIRICLGSSLSRLLLGLPPPPLTFEEPVPSMGLPSMLAEYAGPSYVGTYTGRVLLQSSESSIRREAQVLAINNDRGLLGGLQNLSRLTLAE